MCTNIKVGERRQKRVAGAEVTSRKLPFRSLLSQSTTNATNEKEEDVVEAALKSLNVLKGLIEKEGFRWDDGKDDSNEYLLDLSTLQLTPAPIQV